MTWATTFDVFRPPPRGPFRSSSGAAAAVRSNRSQAAATRPARRAASSASSGRASCSVGRLGTPNSVPAEPSFRSTTSRSSTPIVAANRRCSASAIDGVARRIGGQGLERELLGLAGAAPAGPVGGGGEGLLRRVLDRDEDRVRHRSSLPPAPDGRRQVRAAPSVASRQPADEPGHRRDVGPVRAERVDERARDDHAGRRRPSRSPGRGPGRLTPKPTADRNRRGGHDVADEPSDRRRQRGPRAGDADERDAVEEAAAPRGDRGATAGRRRRRDEVDDREVRGRGRRASNGPPSSGVRSATITPAAPAAASRRAAAAPSPPPRNWFA